MTALAAVGGSALWAVTPDPRVLGVMTMATGSTPNMASVNMEAITVPTLMVVGTKDGMNRFSIAKASFARIPESTPKALVIIETFINPVDVTAYTAAYAGKPVTPTTVPTSLESVEVMRLTTELAVTFFDTVLDKNTNDGLHFTRYLAPKFLLHHEGDIRSAEVFAGSEEVCPEGQDINCVQN